MTVRLPARLSARLPTPTRLATMLATALYLHIAPVQAGDDVKALLELLMEKGLITQAEYDAKIKKAQEMEEIRAFNEAQDVRRANREIDKRAEDERKFKTQIYGQLSAGWYQASNMTSANKDADGMADQPKGNNRIGLRVTRELDADNTAVVTLESNFSARTGAIGANSGAFGSNATTTSNNVGLLGSVFDREANVRWISKTYGTFILGRAPGLQNDLSGAFDARQNWNFGGLKPIGRYAGFHSASGVNRADRMFRYISPVIEGFNVDGGMSWGGAPEDGEKGSSYYLGGRYRNGNFEMGYNHIEAKIGDSFTTPASEVNNRVDFLAAKYTLDKLTLNAGYVISKNPTNSYSFNTGKANGRVNANTFFTGAVYRFTPAFSWNVGYYDVSDQSPTGSRTNGLSMFATGLTWSPYKDWDFFADYAAVRRLSGATGAFTLYDRWVPDTSTARNCVPTTPTAAGCSDSTANQSGFSVGAQFKF